MGSFVELPRQLRGAQVRAESFDAAANTVSVIWTTGAKVRRYSWRDSAYYDEELVVEPGAVRLDRLNAGAPFLNTHSDWSLEDVIGSVVPGSARVEKGNGHATIKLSAAPGDADNVAKIKDGIIRNVSVGYIIHRVEKMEADDGTVPVWRVTDWEPIEVSAVPVPADPGAMIRRAAAAKDSGEMLYRAVVVENALPLDLVRARMVMRAHSVGIRASSFSVGDRVKVKTGKEHDMMTKDKTGTIKQISTSALGIKFDGMSKVHKWYVDDEVETAVE